MASNIFSAGRVGTVSVTGLEEAQKKLQSVLMATDPAGGLRPQLMLAAGLVHRYMMGISRDTPPVSEEGVLPVITGRLKNSFFFGVTTFAGGAAGFVRTNLSYAEEVNRRRKFVENTVRRTEGPVNDLLSRYVAGVVR